jgi:aromatic ring-opening dioxygenase catalytic subunit (LigB family)
MAIVGAAVVPHSPLLLPTIARDHAALFTATHEAITALGEQLYAAQPDKVIVITPHSATVETLPVIYVADQYRGTFTEFGDISTEILVPGAPGTGHQLKTSAERHHVPLALRTYDTLDYGTSVPLSCLWPLPLTPPPTIPLIVTGIDMAAALALGQLLYDHCAASRERFVIIASADMSRRRRSTPVTHARPTAEEKILSQAILAVDPAMSTEQTIQPDTCGALPVTILLAAIQELHPTATITSFAAPMGVGLLTAGFSFNG